MGFRMQFISVCLLSGHTLQITIQITAIYPVNTIHSYKYGIAYIKKLQCQEPKNDFKQEYHKVWHIRDT